MFRDASDALDALRLNPHILPAGAKPGAAGRPTSCSCLYLFLAAACPSQPLLWCCCLNVCEGADASAAPCAGRGSSSSDDSSEGSNGSGGSPPPPPHGEAGSDALARSLGAPGSRDFGGRGNHLSVPADLLSCALCWAVLLCGECGTASLGKQLLAPYQTGMCRNDGHEQRKWTGFSLMGQTLRNMQRQNDIVACWWSEGNPIFHLMCAEAERDHGAPKSASGLGPG